MLNMLRKKESLGCFSFPRSLLKDVLVCPMGSSTSRSCVRYARNRMSPDVVSLAVTRTYGSIKPSTLPRNDTSPVDSFRWSNITDPAPLLTRMYFPIHCTVGYSRSSAGIVGSGSLYNVWKFACRVSYDRITQRQFSFPTSFLSTHA